MKHACTLLLILCLHQIESYSQSKLDLGIRFTPQNVSFRYNQGISTSLDLLTAAFPNKFAPRYSRFRTAQGIGLVYHPSKKFTLGADALYSLMGGGYRERKVNLNYFKIPIWVGYNASPTRRIIFTVQSGIELSYLMSARIKTENGETNNIRKYLNKTNWGIPLAIGFKFKAHATYYITTQLYLYSDFYTLSKTNKEFGAFNYVYPGFRICIDQNFSYFKKK